MSDESPPISQAPQTSFGYACSLCDEEAIGLASMQEAETAIATHRAAAHPEGT